MSIIEGLSIFYKNACYNNYATVYLSLGSFSRQFKMKSFASEETLVIFENLISSYT